MQAVRTPRPGTAIALLGAECTGKSTLAQALADHIRASTGQSCALVPETLRQWCEEHGRTPMVGEQLGILQAHHRKIAAAKESHDWVVCDTSALMTAVYSQLIFGDASLLAQAQQLHREHIQHSLLMALDLPWQADGIQRDGPQVRGPVDGLLRQALVDARLEFSVIHGTGSARLHQAVAALPFAAAVVSTGNTPNAELAQAPPLAAKRQAAWQCTCCSVPEFERLLGRQA